MTLSKRIALLVVIALIAGVVFASVTTRTMHSAALKDERPASAALSGERAANAAPSWDDQGMSVITDPAPPIGQNAWNAAPDNEGSNGYADGYGAEPVDGDQTSQYDTQDTSPRRFDRGDDGDSDPAPYADVDEQTPAQASRTQAPDRQDTAAQAAARAREAAQDVRAAEAGN